MIVSFYPGAGGNRYIQYVLGRNWDDQRVSYDYAYFQYSEHRYLLADIPAVNEFTLTHSVNSSQINKALPDDLIVFIKADLQKSLRRAWILHGHDRYMRTVSDLSFFRLEHYKSFKDDAWPDATNIKMLDALPSYIINEVNKNFDEIKSTLMATSPDKIDLLKKDCMYQIDSAAEIIKWHKKYYDMHPEDFSRASEIIDIENDTSEFAQLMKSELGLYHSEIFDKVWLTIYESE